MEQGLLALLALGSWGTILALLGITALLSYIFGCCNGAVLVSKYILHDDVRNHGSGNAGLTNFLRTFGGKLTAAVLVTDLIKMALAIWVTWLLFSIPSQGSVPAFVKYWAGLFCVAGHMYPCMFRLHGGKGILCGGMLAILVDWRVALFVWGAFFVGVALTRWVSLGSCCGAVAFGISSVAVFQTFSISLIALLITLVMLWKHRGNLARMVRGEEPKLSFHRKKESQ